MPVVRLAYPGLVHGFAQMGGICPAAERAASEIVDAVRQAWTARASAPAPAYGGAGLASAPAAGHNSPTEA
ncbi:MAG: hypothetical protein R3F59_08825 [Myxococcota bacterium]